MILLFGGESMILSRLWLWNRVLGQIEQQLILFELLVIEVGVGSGYLDGFEFSHPLIIKDVVADLLAVFDVGFVGSVLSCGHSLGGFYDGICAIDLLGVDYFFYNADDYIYYVKLSYS